MSNDPIVSTYHMVALIRDAVDDPMGRVNMQRLVDRCHELYDKAQETDVLRDRVNQLENAIRKTLDDNRNLADGDDCTLADLKKMVPDWV